MNRQKFKSGTAFQDMLFLMLSGVTVLWVLSFILINPVAKVNDIESPAQFMITMDWDNTSEDDIDMWLRTPDGSIVYFANKDAGGANLERDDLGKANDCITNSNFEETCILINREVIMLRGLQEGEYQLKFHVFRMGGKIPTGNPVTMEIIDLTPYTVEFHEEFNYVGHRQHVSVIRFTIDSDGDLESFSLVPVTFTGNNRTPPTETDRERLAGRSI